jgi:hypothetical protein
VEAWNKNVRRKNKIMLLKQRVGLGLICLSFIVQAVGAFLV